MKTQWAIFEDRPEPKTRCRVKGGDEDADGAGEDVHGEKDTNPGGLGFGADSDEGEVGDGEVDEAVVDEARRERAGPVSRGRGRRPPRRGGERGRRRCRCRWRRGRSRRGRRGRGSGRGCTLRRARDGYVVHVASGENHGRQPSSSSSSAAMERRRGRFRRGNGGAGRRDGIASRDGGRCLVPGFHAEHVVQRVEVPSWTVSQSPCRDARDNPVDVAQGGRDRESARGATRARTH